MSFSVIIPTYNRPEMLACAIKSVLDQKYTDFELIIVNDHIDPIELEISSDPRVHLINSCKQKGPASARNVGLAVAQRKYISFLDDDDYFDPTFLTYTSQYLNKASPNIGMAWTNAWFVSDENVESTYELNSSQLNESSLIDEFLCIGTGYGVTFKRECLHKVGGFDESYRHIEDTELFIRALSVGYLPLHIPEFLVSIVEHSNDRQTKISNYPRRIRECKALLKKHRSFLSKNTRIISQIHWSIYDLERSVKSANLEETLD